MNTEGGKTVEDLKKDIDDGKVATMFPLAGNTFKGNGLLVHEGEQYVQKRPALMTDAIDNGQPLLHKSVDEKFVEEEKLKEMNAPVKEEKPEMTGELSYLDVAGLAAPNNNLLVRIPDSCYIKGKMRLVSPMITGFLPVALVGPTADLWFTDVDGNTRQVEIGDYVMLEEMNYPTVALGEERRWDAKTEPFKNTYLIIGSHQVLVVKGNPNRVVPVDNIQPCEEPYTPTTTPSLTTTTQL